MAQYLPVVTLAVLAVVFVVLSVVASRLLAPSRQTVAKRSPYECGIIEQAAIPERFNVRFYLVAMLFIMFDIEIVFLYPWAVANAQLGLFGFMAMLLFVGVFFLSFVYELAMGGLEWGPSKPSARPLAASQRVGDVGATRLVGFEGRVEAWTSADDAQPTVTSGPTDAIGAPQAATAAVGAAVRAA